MRKLKNLAVALFIHFSREIPTNSEFVPAERPLALQHMFFRNSSYDICSLETEILNL